MDRRIDDVRPAQGLDWEGAGGLTLERSVTEPCRRCNGTGEWTYTEDAGDVGSEYKCQDCEPAQVQPVAAALPASDDQTLDRLSAAIMNIKVPDNVKAELEGSPKGFYLLGHRDARHAAAELVNEFAAAPVLSVGLPSQPAEQSGSTPPSAEHAGQCGVGGEWMPIETAPRGANGYSFMQLAWGPEGDQSIGDGMRWGDRFFAAGVFYCLGQDRLFQLREIEVRPTHWMPNQATPAESSPIAEPDTAAQAAKPLTDDTARLDMLFALMPLAMFCRAVGAEQPEDTSLRSQSDWARKALDSAIESHLKGE